MFTGLIQQTGLVRAASRSGSSYALEIELSAYPEDIALGESIAVDGVCLTVTRFVRPRVWMDVSFESLERTTLKDAHSSRRVNLERALRLSDRLGGHIVSGHVDGVGMITSLLPRGEFREITVRFPDELAKYLAEKGSVAIDGISLTVNTVTRDSFSVAVIPHTMSETTIQDWRVGRKVNLEVDVIARYVERMMGSSRNEKGLESWLAGGDFFRGA